METNYDLALLPLFLSCVKLTQLFPCFRLSCHSIAATRGPHDRVWGVIKRDGWQRRVLKGEADKEEDLFTGVEEVADCE